MTGVLILAHGSRAKETEETLAKIVAMVKDILDLEHIASSFLQFSDSNLPKGLSELMALGVNDIKVIPYFLFEGMHIQEDIPKEIDCFLAEHPDVKITLGRTLGADSRLARVLADRIQELI